VTPAETEETDNGIADDRAESETATNQSAKDSPGNISAADGPTAAAQESNRDLAALANGAGVTLDTVRLQDKSSSPKALVIKPVTFLNGKVVDAEDGKGLPGVNVIAKGKQVGTITDEDGNYKLPLDSIDQGLMFSFIGYENKEIANPENNESVVLNPDIAQLSEVVVVGYGGVKREDPIFDPVVELAEPVGGRRAYKAYLQQSIRYPEQALNNKVEGRVTVQFTLEPNGSLKDFRVLKGLGYGCDDEVIRLIKEGPKWNPSRKNTEPVADRVKVRVKFTLPKK
jgi:TonB family protein